MARLLVRPNRRIMARPHSLSPSLVIIPSARHWLELSNEYQGLTLLFFGKMFQGI